MAAHANYHSFGPTSQFRVDANSPQQQGTDRVLASPALYIPNEMPGFCRRMFYSDEWSHKAASPQETILIVKSMRKWIVGALILALAAGLYWRLRPKTACHRRSLRRRADHQGLEHNRAGEPKRRRTCTGATRLKSWRGEPRRRRCAQWQALLAGLIAAPYWIGSLAAETHFLVSSPLHAPPGLGPGPKCFTNLRVNPVGRPTHLSTARRRSRVHAGPSGGRCACCPRASVFRWPPGSPDEAPKREDWLFVSVAPRTPFRTRSQPALERPPVPADDSGQANQAYLVTGNDSGAQPGRNARPGRPTLAGGS